MLSLRSSGLFARTAAWADERRNSRLDKVAVPLLTIGIDRGDGRLETMGAVEGTTGTAMLGDGGR
jgi:hypothetical protein